MLDRLSVCILSPQSATAGAPSGPGARRDHGRAVEGAHRLLSHDLFEGRAPSTRGGELAAEYLAAQLAAIGLRAGRRQRHVLPAGADRRVGRRSRLHAERARPHLSGTTTTSWRSPAWRTPQVHGAGRRGVRRPRHRRAGAEVERLRGRGHEGQVGADHGQRPAGARPTSRTLFGGKALTYYGRWTYKFEEAARQGAAGALLIHTDESATYPWQVVQSSWTGTQYSLPPAPGAPALGVKAWMTERRGRRSRQARRAGSRRAARGGRRSAASRPVPLGDSRRGDARSRRSARKTSPNVDRRAEGHQRAAGGRLHLALRSLRHARCRARATSRTPTASSTAPTTTPPAAPALLEIAQAMARAGAEPGRSMYVRVHDRRGVGPARRRVLRAASAAADGPDCRQHQHRRHQLSRADQATSCCSAPIDRRSGRWRTALAEERGRVVGPDQHPERGYFFRSDHFPLAKAGVPALSISEPREFVGPERRGAEEEAGSLQRHGLPPAERRVRSDVGLQRRRRGHAAARAARLAHRRDAGDAALQRRRQFANARKQTDDALTTTLVTKASTTPRPVTLDGHRSRCRAYPPGRTRHAARRGAVAGGWPRRQHALRSSARTCSRWAPSRFAAPTTCWRSCRATTLARGVITYSSGNHGQAVALAAQTLGVAGGGRDADDRAAR